MGLGYSAMVWLVDNMAVDNLVIKTLQFVSMVSSTACPGIFCTTVQKERSTRNELVRKAEGERCLCKKLALKGNCIEGPHSKVL